MFQETAQPCPKRQGIVTSLGQHALWQCIGACPLDLRLDRMPRTHHSEGCLRSGLRTVSDLPAPGPSRSRRPPPRPVGCTTKGKLGDFCLVPARIERHGRLRPHRVPVWKLADPAPISVVMDNLPSTRFSTIDVRDAIVGGHRFSSQRILPVLDTEFVGYIPDDLDELIFQFDLPSRNYFSYSVVGYNDIPDAERSDPPLTTVDALGVQKGRTAARIVFEGGPPRHELLKPRLIIRASTGPAPGH